MCIVEDISQLTVEARALGKESFSQRFQGQLFLVKPRGQGVRCTAVPESAHTYQTSQARVTARDLDVHDVFGAELRVWRIQKKKGNPYQDRISVGRARNCDLVLRAPYLSKLHAHFWREPNGTFRLSDNRSANGTRINGQALAPGLGHRVSSGDRVAFGGLELLLLGASDLHPLLAG